MNNVDNIKEFTCGEWFHGASAYRRRKCRCVICKSAKAAAQAEYRLTPAYKESQKRGRATPQGKAALARRNAAYYATPEGMKRCKAQSAANKAARMGVLVKLPCRVCGNANAQAHHADYNKPLVVVWLCVKHHKELHRRFNNGEIKCL